MRKKYLISTPLLGKRILQDSRLLRFKQLLGLFHKGTKVSKVILMAQLTRELNLLLFFLAPISTIRRFLLVLVSLSFLSSIFLPIRLFIALLRGLCKNIFIMGGGGNFCFLCCRLLNRQLMKLLRQRLYGGRVYGPNHTIGMGSRLRLLRIVGRPQCLKDNLIQDPRLCINQIQLLGPENGFLFIRHS